MIKDRNDLPELPTGWILTKFEELSEAIPNALKAGPFGSALKKEFYMPQGYKIYGQEQVIREDPFTVIIILMKNVMMRSNLVLLNPEIFL